MEKSLWRQGCLSWSDFLENPDQYSCGSVGTESMCQQLALSQKALAEGDFDFFRSGLGLSEAWRAYPHFKDRCAYLDIETDGGRAGSSVTTIGIYDGTDFHCFIKGQNLNDFPEAIKKYAMIVTFFGAGFDLPMLQKCFRGIRFNQIHLDLCPTLRRVGLRGGLKKIEKQLGIQRGDDTDGLDGLDAIRLWRRYTALKDESALETLVAYNREDVVNLEVLAQVAYDKLSEYVTAVSEVQTEV